MKELDRMKPISSEPDRVRKIQPEGAASELSMTEPVSGLSMTKPLLSGLSMAEPLLSELSMTGLEHRHLLHGLMKSASRGIAGGAVPRVLTIAGSDSGGGAGIQADLKTFQELGAFGMSVITAVTVQNSLGVNGVYPLPVQAVEEQLDAVLGDLGADAVKTGMLFSADIVEAAAARLERCASLRLVVDPVMISKHGSRLLREDAAEALRLRLLPLAEVVTPNIPEACALLGLQDSELGSLEAMKDAARELLKSGCRHVFLKGGHLDDANAAADVLLSASSPRQPLVLSVPRIHTRHTHGTGCTSASAIAALLARGLDIRMAAEGAKLFTLAAIAAGGPIGRGTGVLWHAAWRNQADSQKI